MLSPSEARAEILRRVPAPAPAAGEAVPLAEAAGRVLARPVVSDVDLPPFEKSMMDGFALRAADAPRAGEARLRVVGESRAGRGFDGELSPGTCVEIYTGAELPRGADAVLMVEHARREGDVLVLDRPVAPGQHVSPQGEILRVGREVLGPGRRLSPADVAVLAAVGCEPVTVFPRPRVAVLTTGDELVPPSARPGPGQIREGNTLYLAAACRGLGCAVHAAGIAPDEPAALARALSAALEAGDALITTGGVSVGRYDLVGAALESLGVEPVLHKVAIKPGKPIWFGLLGAKPVFGLPGNPVSALLGFEVFVRPALSRLEGGAPAEQEERLGTGRWIGPPLAARDRQQNEPATLRFGPDGTLELVHVPWRGSADLVAISRADALAIVPAGGEIRPGDRVDYRPLDRGHGRGGHGP